jgi:hypothetical protein
VQQIAGSQYSGTRDCMSSILKQGRSGIRTLYASYPTTLIMNVPFMALFLSTYESVKLRFESADLLHGTPQHLVSAALAGALAGGVTTPLDVIKTVIFVDLVCIVVLTICLFFRGFK